MHRIVSSLVETVDDNTCVKLDSSPHSTEYHPAFTAIVGMGNMALPELFERLKWNLAHGWTEIHAIDAILGPDRPKIPKEHSGKIDDIKNDFVKWWETGADGMRCEKCHWVSKRNVCPVCDGKGLYDENR